MMKRRHIVAAAKNGNANVLVTVVHAEGPSKRQTGACLLTASATSQVYTGAINSGDLEAEVVRTAAEKVSGGPIVERYPTLCDDLSGMPYSLDCAGTIDLLFEPARTPEFNALMFAMRSSLQGESYTVITWLPGKEQPFARAVIASDGCVEFATEGLLPIAITSALVHGSRSNQNTGSVHIERLEPPQRLIVLGAGDDAKPLVRVASLLGWNVVVIDARPQFARLERFPEAQRVCLATSRDAACLGVTGADAVVLMTHSYEQDRAWLAALLPIAPRYLGVLGAKDRSSLLVSEAAAMTDLSLQDCCERISIPVGPDLDGDAPEAIALTVISEAHTACMGKPSTSVRLSVLDVAAHAKQCFVSYYMQAQGALAASQIN